MRSSIGRSTWQLVSLQVGPLADGVLPSTARAVTLSPTTFDISSQYSYFQTELSHRTVSIVLKLADNHIYVVCTVPNHSRSPQWSGSVCSPWHDGRRWTRRARHRWPLVWLKMTKFGIVAQVVEQRVSIVSHVPITTGGWAGAPTSTKFSGPIHTSKRLTQNDGTITLGWCVSSATAPSKRVWPQPPPISLGPALPSLKWRNSNDPSEWWKLVQ